MKRFTLLLFAFVLSAATFAQTPSRPMRDVSAQQGIDLQNHNLLHATQIQQAPPGHQSGGLRDLTYVQLGSAGNGLTVLNNQCNVISVDQGTNTVCFVHRNDFAATGLGSSSNYNYDVSKDGGFIFNLNMGLLNPLCDPVNSFNGRYPQCALFNPSGTATSDSFYMAYLGTWHNGSANLNTWDGTSSGVARADGATNTWTETTTEANNKNVGIFASMVQSSPGTFWTIAQEFDQDDLTNYPNDSNYVVLKGIWNAVTRDVDWTVSTIITLAPDLSYDGNTYDITPVINFDPTGQRGWIVIVGDFFPDDGIYVYQPVLIGTVDGGNTWSEPVLIDLTQFASVAGVMDPQGSNVPTTGFEGDLVVDSKGNPHYVTVVGSGSNTQAYSIESGLSHHIMDITKFGDSYEVRDIYRLYTFRGFVGVDVNTGGNYSEDNRCQATRTEDGSYLYFSWIETDTLLVDPNDINGYDNSFPDLWIAGEDPSTGFITAPRNITVGTDFDTKSFMPHMSPTCLRNATDDASILPLVVLQVNDDGFFTSPAYFWYLNNVNVDDAEFPVGVPSVSAPQVQVSQNYPNPFADQTQINVTLVKASGVNLKVTNTLGQEVYNNDFNFSAGTHGISLSKGNLGSGVYNFTVSTDGAQVTKTMIIQ